MDSTYRRIGKHYVNNVGQNFDIISLRHQRNLPYYKEIPHLGTIGIDWIPPMTALIRMTQIPIKHHSQVEKSTSLNPPGDSFRWDLIDHVKGRYQCSDLPLSSYVNSPEDQKTCGSCWAFSGAGFFGDRWKIWTQSPVPPLSSTVILSCAKNPNGNGCNGGNANADYKVCSSIGLPPQECIPYDWCGDLNCSNNGIPQCLDSTSKYESKCGDGSVHLCKKTSSGSANAAVGKYNEDYSVIMEELWQNGPMMTGYVVYADFYGPTDQGQNPTLWSKTNGIYMNANDVYGYKWDGAPSWNVKMGNHMVVMVGWGKTRISGFTGPSFTLSDGTKTSSSDIYYWVIRNSWGTSWNANNQQVRESGQKGGYFYIAWAGDYQINGRKYEINKRIGLDHTNSQGFGGCWFFSPDTDVILPEGCSIPGPDEDQDQDQDTEECSIDEDCGSDGTMMCQNGICVLKDSPQPTPSPNGSSNFWNKLWNGIDKYFSGCEGSCTWGEGQCVKSTPDLCDMISQGTGMFEASKTCAQALPISYKKNSKNTSTSPCIFQNDMCVMSTEQICNDKIKGSWKSKYKDCKEARENLKKNICPNPLDNNDNEEDKNENKNQMDVVAIIGISLLGLFFLILLVFIIYCASSKSKDTNLSSSPSYLSSFPSSFPSSPYSLDIS